MLRRFMLLAIDIGNTTTVVGVFEAAALRAQWRLATAHDRSSDEMGVLLHAFFDSAGLAPADIDALMVATVVPALTERLRELGLRYFGHEPTFVGPGMRSGMPILVDSPREVGADRIANSVAAFHLVEGACIVVDLGTATTLDVVTAKGEYAGGVIAPGWQIAAEALFRRASKLPRVELVEPPGVVGKNTVHSMQSGLFHGYVSMVDGLVRKIRAEMSPAEPAVLATGGLSESLVRASDEVKRFEPNLTLLGLRLLHERQR
jgi:type III pantothenate kinase